MHPMGALWAVTRPNPMTGGVYVITYHEPPPHMGRHKAQPQVAGNYEEAEFHWVGYTRVILVGV